ncbi:MAG TPA: nicotinate phosphoribosyltransferase, partial [Rhodospirillaceae bacterium]|nr:nicotinate phosphoribosyltransferase [Rhodospirillaceae bacterium]
MSSKVEFDLPPIDLTNPLLNTDSYKASHFLQYKPGTEYVSSYIEARNGDQRVDYTLFFGLQIFLATALARRITADDVAEAATFWEAHGEPFHRDGWDYIVEHHGGRLPLRIEAVREGTILPVGHVQLQIVNTDPACFWLTSFLETALLRAVWYPTTIATNSWACVAMIADALEETDGSREGAEFKLHDFGARGVSSFESAGIGGAAHLIASRGTDTVSGAVYARNYYGAEMAGYSIPAAEHSTMTSWGGEEGEPDAMQNMIDSYKDFGARIFACVSDSYDVFRAVNDYWGDRFKDQILNLDGTLVVRPDSGEPVEIVPAVIEALMDRFGFAETDQGYRLLPSQVRVIQGDGITRNSLKSILAAMRRKKLAVANVAFGMGGGLLQKHDRDTFGYAMKASACRIGGDWQDVFKQPRTDPGKVSKKGRLALVKDDNGLFETVRLEELGTRENQLETVFEDGEIKRV